MRRVFVFVLFIQYIICFTHNPFQSSNFGNNRYALTSEKSCRFGECQPVVDCAGRFTPEERVWNLCTFSRTEVGLCCKKLSHNDVLHHRTHDKTLTNGIPLCEKSFRSFGNDHLAGNTVAVRFPIFNVTNILAINRTTSGFYLYEHQAPKTEAVTTAKVAIENMIKAKKSTIIVEGDICEIENVEAASCDQNFSCDRESPFRNPRGICNNLKRPIFGSVFTPVQRILKNNYFDGFSMPRRANDGRDLPSARFVSTMSTNNLLRPNVRFTNLLMASGQFIDHDLVHVPVFSKEDGEGFDCCSALLGNNTLECFPISIPPNDLEFHPRTCLNFVRSLPAPDIDCRAGPNEQMNQITHWLDSSNIYGSTEEELIALRTFRKGLLTLDPENENLPPNINNDECLDPNNCFLAGDSRVNEQTALTSVHTLWARQHNKVATVLNSQNSTWTDEELFQVTRQIVNAQWQHVVYNEWLPIVLGPTTMQEFGLWTLRKGFSHDYRDDFDPRITNEFAAAAFRVGHTLIPSALRSYNILNAKPTGSLLLRNNFNNPKQLQTPGFLDEITFGMVIQNIEDFDNRISDEIQNHLFELNDEGLDLIAVNLQRGRDHGIPGYIFYLEICGSRKIKRFEDLKYNMALENINLLKRIYNNVKDIDLFIGMLLEVRSKDSLIGRTFLCIITDQFARLKRGDRFFYDLDGKSTGSFTLEQLNEIRKFSFSRLICDNTNIPRIQPFALENANHQYNIITSCDSPSIPSPQYTIWSSIGRRQLKY